MSKVCSICGKGRLSGNGREDVCLHQVLEDDEQECRLRLFDKVHGRRKASDFLYFMGDSDCRVAIVLSRRENVR